MSAVEHPSHYNSHPSGVECIDVVQHMNFNLGNAVKYIWRCDEKGNPIQDLEKAIFYLKQEIKRRQAQQQAHIPGKVRTGKIDASSLTINLYNPVDYDKTVAEYRRQLHDREVRADPGGLY